MKTRTTALVGITTLAVAMLAMAETPRGAASATIGGKKVTIDYGRPALKGRNLEDMMKQLPADRMWRAGDNQVSTLATEGAIQVGDKTLPAGKYSLYVHAGEGNNWSLVLNKDLGVPLGQIYAGASDKMKNEPWPHIMDYTKAIADKEVVRAKMAAAKAGAPAELFTVSLAAKGKGAELTLAWGTQAWSLELQPAK
jgi:hypothetical protein